MHQGSSKWWQPISAITTTIVIAIAVLTHQWSLNADGPHWVLDWQHLPAFEVYPWLCLAVVPLVAAQFIWSRWHRRGLLLLMFSAMALQFLGVCVRAQPLGIKPLVSIVQSRGSMSYSIAAAQMEQTGILTGLRNYPALMPAFPVHGREKPPGPVLYYYLFGKLFGYGTTMAVASGLGILLFTSLSVPATYLLGRSFLHDRTAAFHAATLICLTPAMVMFFPFFDPCYIPVFCFMYLAWDRWLATGHRRFAFAFAVVILCVTFWAYNVLVAGALLGARAVYRWLYGRPCTGARIVSGVAVTVALLGGAYGALHLATGFNAIATFRTALTEQTKADNRMGRFYLNTMPTNLLGFMMGTGPGLLVCAAITLFRRPQSRSEMYRETAMLIGVGQVAVVALSGLLKCETERVWMFLLPLIAIPAGREISQWTPRLRVAFYAACWFLAVACLQNMRAATFHLR